MPQIINIADEMRQNNLAYQQQQDDQLKRQLLRQQIQVGPVHNALASAQLQDYLRNQQDTADIRQTAQQNNQMTVNPTPPQPDATGNMQLGQSGAPTQGENVAVALVKKYISLGKTDQAAKTLEDFTKPLIAAGDMEGAARLASKATGLPIVVHPSKKDIMLAPAGSIGYNVETGKTEFSNPKESTDTAAEVDRKEELKWIKDNTLPGGPPPTHLDWLTAKSAATAKASDKTPPTNVYREQFYKENGRYPTIAETDAHEKANRPPKEAATVTIQTVNDQGVPVTQVMTKAEALKKSAGAGGGIVNAPSAMTKNRIVSANNSLKAGNKVIQMLQDPIIKAKLGPVMGRVTGLQGLIGSLPPDMAELAGALKSWTELQPAVHGMRSSEMAEDIEKSVPLRWTPEALAGFIRGFNRTATIVANSEVPTPPPDATGKTADLNSLRDKYKY